MPPLLNVTDECVLALQQIFMRQYPQTTLECLQHLNRSSTGSSGKAPTDVNSYLEKSELEAVLYIVVTLLFYSLGIIVGIITYLKREKEEIEESKIFEQYLLSYSDRSKVYKVQEVVARLKVLNEQKQRAQTLTLTTSHLEAEGKLIGNSKMASDGQKIHRENSMENEPDVGCDDENDEDTPLSTLIAKLINSNNSKCGVLDLDGDGGEDDDVEIEADFVQKRALHKIPSVQSIKDYTEEPKTSARNSVTSDDEDDREKSNKSAMLLNQKSVTSIDLEHETFTPDISIHKGCIVTNV